MAGPGMGMGGGLVTFLPFAVILLVVIIIVAAKGSGRGGSVLVLKEFVLNEGEDEFLKIRGRAAGFVGWLLSVIGVDPVTSLTCNKQTIKFESSAIKYGKETLDIPLAAVSGVCSGVRKPFALLVLGIVFIVFGIVAAPMIGGTAAVGAVLLFLIIGAGFLVLYVLNKTMQFGIYTGGDKPIATIRVKKSIIEGQNIDIAKYEAAARALLKAVVAVR